MADPAFAAPQAGDFRLAPGSVARAAGTQGDAIGAPEDVARIDMRPAPQRPAAATAMERLLRRAERDQLNAPLVPGWREQAAQARPKTQSPLDFFEAEAAFAQRLDFLGEGLGEAALARQAMIERYGKGYCENTVSLFLAGKLSAEEATDRLTRVNESKPPLLSRENTGSYCKKISENKP